MNTTLMGWGGYSHQHGDTATQSSGKPDPGGGLVQSLALERSLCRELSSGTVRTMSSAMGAKAGHPSEAGRGSNKSQQGGQSKWWTRSQDSQTLGPVLPSDSLYDW